jgi:hypothetical protein
MVKTISLHPYHVMKNPVVYIVSFGGSYVNRNQYSGSTEKHYYITSKVHEELLARGISSGVVL